MTALSNTSRRARRWSRTHDGDSCALHLHARGVHRLRSHRARAGDSAYAFDVRLELRARHRAGGGDGRARRRGHATREDHWLHRRVAGSRQCNGRLRGDRAHAGDVQIQRNARRESQRNARMSDPVTARFLIQASYFVTAALFIIGLKRMSSPVTARSGIWWAGAGMLVATLVTFLYPGMSNYPLIGA